MISRLAARVEPHMNTMVHTEEKISLTYRTCEVSLLSHVNSLKTPTASFISFTFACYPPPPSCFISTPTLSPISPHLLTPMKDLSFFLLKNSLASKMKKGLRNFCHGVGSTSTLNQRTADRDMSCLVTPSSLISSYIEDSSMEGSPPTLEEMILKLDLEEAALRKARLVDDPVESRRRMSCVNNSDILRSARNALNQYPRFSLDGRDSMYRSTFRSFAPRMAAYASGWQSACCEPDLERSHGLPSTLGGESVVWCKPGVVPKLMGLEAIPVPISSTHCNGRLMSSKIRQKNPRRVERNETQKKILVMGTHGCGGARRQTMGMGEPSNVNYCTAKPIRRIR